MDATRYKVTLDITREEYRVMQLALDALILRSRTMLTKPGDLGERIGQQYLREFCICEGCKKQLMDRFTIAFGRNGKVT